MAGARPSGFKKGGGFLNNVDGVITGYEFTTEFPGAESRPAKKSGKDDFNPLYAILKVRVDGADEDVATTLFAGSADDFEIEDDGHTLTPVDDSVGLRANTDWARLLTSLVDAGFPESNLPEDRINFEPIIGTRVRFKQERDEAAMVKAARSYRTSNGKFNERGEKKGKDGKYYPLTYVVVEAVLALPGSGTTKGKPAAKAVAGKPTPVKGATKPVAGKANGKVQEDLTALADETLQAILADNDGEIMKSKLPVKIAQKLGVKHPHREEVRRLIYSDEYLVEAAERGVVLYDPSDKTQTIYAAA